MSSCKTTLAYLLHLIQTCEWGKDTGWQHQRMKILVVLAAACAECSSQEMGIWHPPNYHSLPVLWDSWASFLWEWFKDGQLLWGRKDIIRQVSSTYFVFANIFWETPASICTHRQLLFFPAHPFLWVFSASQIMVARRAACMDRVVFGESYLIIIQLPAILWLKMLNP